MNENFKFDRPQFSCAENFFKQRNQFQLACNEYLFMAGL